MVPKEIPFDRACLIGCGVMTGVGAALKSPRSAMATRVMVIGCGAVGLAAVQGARLAGAGAIIAVDLDDGEAALGGKTRRDRMPSTRRRAGSGAVARAVTAGRGADFVFEAAGHPAAFRLTVEAVRPGGQVVWLGKIDVDDEVAFRWGSLMGEKRIARVELWRRAAARATFRGWRGPISTAAQARRADHRAACKLDEINDGFDDSARGEIDPHGDRVLGRGCHLAPLAGRGRAEGAGEGDSPRISLSPCSQKQSLTPTLSPRKSGEREKIASKRGARKALDIVDQPVGGVLPPCPARAWRWLRQRRHAAARANGRSAASL